MKNILPVLIILTACVGLATAAPKEPASKEPNLAIRYVRTLNGRASCLPVSTDVAKAPDTAVCTIGKTLNYCWAGTGVASGCTEMPVATK